MKNRSTELEHTAETPFQIVVCVEFVLVRAMAIVFAEIEGGIRKNRVDAVVAKGCEQIHAIRLVHRSPFGSKCWFHDTFAGGDYQA